MRALTATKAKSTGHRPVDRVLAPAAQANWRDCDMCATGGPTVGGVRALEVQS